MGHNIGICPLAVGRGEISCRRNVKVQRLSTTDTLIAHHYLPLYLFLNVVGVNNKLEMLFVDRRGREEIEVEMI